MSATPRVPKYRKHPNGQGFIEHAGIRRYLGKHGSQESLARYRQEVDRILAGVSQPIAGPLDLTIAEVCSAYLDHAKKYYGEMSQEYKNFRTALTSVIELFGAVKGRDVGPRILVALQQHWTPAKDWARTNINHQIGRVKRMLRWACKNELIPPEISYRLQCVDGLRAGKCDARESDPVRPVDPQHVDAVLPFLSPTVAAMVQVQRFCGMRPSEVCGIRGADINRNGEIWLYCVDDHKNAWRGQQLVKAIPRRVQSVLAAFVDEPGFLFSPLRAERDRIGKIGRRKKLLRDHYDADSYRQAVGYGFDKAKRRKIDLVRWHPNQLRHTSATEVSQALGQQAAQRWLGHADLDATAIYAEKEVRELVAIAQELDRRWATQSTPQQ